MLCYMTLPAHEGRLRVIYIGCLCMGPYAKGPIEHPMYVEPLRAYERVEELYVDAQGGGSLR